ncbi:MAG: RsiV family protein [Candidatus Margulisiibacteriota bacterium]
MALLIQCTASTLHGSELRRPGQSGDFSRPLMVDVQPHIRAEKTDRYTFDSREPYVLIPGNRDAESRIRSAIQDKVKVITDEFFKYLPEVTSFNAAMTSTFFLRYKLAYRQDYFSIRLEAETYYAGDADPITEVYGLNFNLYNANPVELKSLFDPQVDAWAFLSGYCEDDLRRQFREKGERYAEDWLREGTAPKPTHFQNFLVLERGIVVFFNPNQVGPSALGEREVFIPAGEIANAPSVDYSRY